MFDDGILVDKLVLERRGDVQRDHAVDQEFGDKAVNVFEKLVRVVILRHRQVRPREQAEERNFARRGRHHGPAAERHADHDDVKQGVQRMGGSVFPLRARHGRRRLIGEAQPQANKAEQQDRYADRLVQRGDGDDVGIVRVDAPAQEDHKQDQARDEPVQPAAVTIIGCGFHQPLRCLC